MRHLLLLTVLLFVAFSAWGQNVTNQWLGQSLYIGMPLTTTPSAVGSLTWNLEVTITNVGGSNFSVTPTLATNLIIAWGDGSISNYTGSAQVSHTYSSASTNILSLSGIASQILFLDPNSVLTRSLTVIQGLTNLTSFLSTFQSSSALKSMPTNLFSNLTNVNTLRQTWYGCSAATSFPVVSTLTNVNTLYSTWQNCSAATSFPVVSTLTNVNTLFSTWQNCSAATSFPVVSTLTNVNTLFETWYGCSAMTNIPTLFTNSTALVNVSYAFSGDANMKGSSVQFWNKTNFPNITVSNNCYTGCTNLSDYATIPTGWK
jgi:hypothetical protein